MHKYQKGEPAMDDKITLLRKMLSGSRYTVALCGSGMMEEGGFIGVKKQEKAYAIEEKYGYCSDELYTSAFYNTRPELFFTFYRNEMLNFPPELTASGPALAALEKKGHLHCVITSNIYDIPRRGGCQNVINLHGTIYENQCPRCKKQYPMEYIMNSKRTVPLCEKCNIPVRPLVSLFGEMVDSQRMTKTTLEISKADTLLLLGTALDSEVFSNYIKYFTGRWLVIIHSKSHYRDVSASLVILDHPKNVLPLLT